MQWRRDMAVVHIAVVLAIKTSIPSIERLFPVTIEKKFCFIFTAVGIVYA